MPIYHTLGTIPRKRHIAFRKPSGVVLGVLLVLPAASAFTQERVTAMADDAALFATIVREIERQSRTMPIKVDPRPIYIDREQLEVDSAALVPTDPELVARRHAFLLAEGIEQIDATISAQNEKCPGWFARFESMDSIGTRDHVYDACPRDRFYAVAIGLGRPGTVDKSNAGVYGTKAQEAVIGYWAVRVAKTDIGPDGATLNAYDYVMQHLPAGWRFVKAVHIFMAE